MDEALTTEPTTGELTNLKRTLEAIFREINEINERIERDQSETERLQALSRKRLDTLKSMV